uniref:Uncharacterized protein n=1 Tax=Lepeophtheirus salmonis TaxID=72036 RepID=A0A0K2VF66_LEPSM
MKREFHFPLPVCGQLTAIFFFNRVE